MPAIDPGKGCLMRTAALGQLSLALLMPLPRISLSLPKKRKGEGDGGGSKVVDWKGRRLTVFHEHRLFPRVSIVFPSSEKAEEDVSVLSDDALIRQMMLDEQEEGAPEGVEESEAIDEPSTPAQLVERPHISLEEAIKKAIAEEPEAEPLEVAKSILNADGTRDVALPAGVELPVEAGLPAVDEPDAIPRGSIVLVEGKKGAGTRAVTENLCYGLLEGGLTVTYVTTSLTVQDFILDMHSHNYRIAQYLPDQRVLVIPVYPLVEGKGETAGLLDKLMASSQLQTTDAIFVDSLSDFLGGHFDDVICMRLLEYLRKLSGAGKTVFLVVEDGQKGILSLRLASDLHIALPSEEGKGVLVKRYQPPKAGAPDVLRFRIDPALGLISQPRKAEAD